MEDVAIRANSITVATGSSWIVGDGFRLGVEFGLPMSWVLGWQSLSELRLLIEAVSVLRSVWVRRRVGVGLDVGGTVGVRVDVIKGIT